MSYADIFLPNVQSNINIDTVAAIQKLYTWNWRWRILYQSSLRRTGDQEVAGSIPAGLGNICFVEIYHKIFLKVIIRLPLIQKG